MVLHDDSGQLLLLLPNPLLKLSEMLVRDIESINQSPKVLPQFHSSVYTLLKCTGP